VNQDPKITSGGGDGGGLIQMTFVKKLIRNRDHLTAFLVLLPSIVLIAIFVYGFIFRTAYSSLTDWEGLAIDQQANYIGLDNYKQLFTGLLDVRFRQSLVNTFYFTAFFIGGCISLGLFFAILLDQGIRFEGFFRIIFLYPMSLSFIVTGTVWRWLLNPKGGINRLPAMFFPEKLGLEPWKIKWITDRTQIWQFDWMDMPKIFGYILLIILIYMSYRYLKNKRNIAAGVMLVIGLATLYWLVSGKAGEIELLKYPEPHGFNVAMIGIILAVIWQMSGYMMAMYLAGIRGIPDDLREAARVDGATELQVYWNIILPMLKPITLSAMIVLGHISLKIFDLIFVVAGPDNATTDMPGVLMFVTAFRGNQFAKGAAIAIVMLIMVAVVIVPYLVSTLRSEQEL
jgi:glucose/mannose transport system permease protein